MKPASSAPVYASLYHELAEAVRKHGYALAIHGSLQRDFDLICVPWAAYPSHSDVVVQDLTRTFALTSAGTPTTKKHGRIAYTLAFAFGECSLDLSFMPTAQEGV